MSTACLITGAAGFIGHHVVSFFLRRTDWELILIDRLDLSSNLGRLKEVIRDEDKKRVTFHWHDLKAPIPNGLGNLLLPRRREIKYVLHLAASSHVDRSIEDPLPFAQDNCIGTVNLLEFARLNLEPRLLVNFSTDEVFGPAAPGHAHKEWEVHKPSNPYSASKSAAAQFGHAYFVTYKMPVITTYTMNNFGERQHPEKLVPKTINRVMGGAAMPIFAELDKQGKLKAVGSRYWLHAENTASALQFLLTSSMTQPGEAYNIIGFDEFSNLEMASQVAKIMGKKLLAELVDFHAARPGHDRRYALDGTKLKDMGWVPPLGFAEALERTVRFTLENPRWL